MLNNMIIQELKQSNISIDPEKTKQRTSQEWKAAGREAQGQILELSGLKRTTVYRVFSTGSISAKLAVAMAQSLDIDPYYLTGQADERGSFDFEALKDMLNGLGYAKLLEKQAKEEKKLQRQAKKQAAMEEAQVEAEPEEVIQAAITPELQAVMDSMTEEDMHLLLKSILYKAKASEEYRKRAEQIKLLLLS